MASSSLMIRTLVSSLALGLFLAIAWTCLRPSVRRLKVWCWFRHDRSRLPLQLVADGPTHTWCKRCGCLLEQTKVTA
jgi:hypothetical protein